jgi:two-component system sensor histidine kinase KdpD
MLGSSKHDGLGIGLQLCQSIVRGHGGTLKISESSPLGAVVTFTLPVAGADSDG